ncbi:MAG: dihydrodipicolinate synthase family protein [Deltaproteobacteria bacterium]|nr:dihydrodipicolinate synthase family protein [Deltaproteobacteria bacterium]MBW2171996.1 dihydrodipicolinate synthase family protein [Deltaproteobacteria bacterium]
MTSETNKLPRGLICPLVTPLKSGDVLDVPALDRLISQAGTGADALLVGDVLWGEGLVLSRETKIEMASAVLEIIQGRWPVLITITSETPGETIGLMAKIESFVERSGYSGSVFWVDYPVTYHSNRGLPQFYEKVARDTATPLILGNNPGLIQTPDKRIKHKNIRTSVLKKLSEIEQIKGLIYTGPLKRSIHYHEALRHRRGFKFYDGDEATFMKRPSSDGVVAGGANLLPQAWHEITWSCLNRYDVQRQYADHVSQIWETGVMAQEFYKLYAKKPVAVLKRMLHVAGVLPNAHAASGTPPTDSADNRAIEAISNKYELL